MSGTSVMCFVQPGTSQEEGGIPAAAIGGEQQQEQGGQEEAAAARPTGGLSGAERGKDEKGQPREEKKPPQHPGQSDRQAVADSHCGCRLTVEVQVLDARVKAWS